MAQAADQASVTHAVHSVAATSAGFRAPTSHSEIGVDVFLKRDDIIEESERKLLVNKPRRSYGLQDWKRDRLELSMRR